MRRNGDLGHGRGYFGHAGGLKICPFACLVHFTAKLSGDIGGDMHGRARRISNVPAFLCHLGRQPRDRAEGTRFEVFRLQRQ